MSTAEVNTLVQARIQNQFQQDYVRDLLALKDYGVSLVPPYDTKPTWGQIKAAMMAAGIPFSHHLEVDTRGVTVADPALTALSGATPAPDTFPYFTSATDAEVSPLTALGRALLAANDQDALAAVIGWQPIEHPAADITARDNLTGVRFGDYSNVAAGKYGPDERYVYTQSGWHLIGDHRPKILLATTPTELSALNPVAGDFMVLTEAGQPTRAFWFDGVESHEIAQKLNMRHVVALNAASDVSTAWNARNLIIDTMDMALFSYQGVVHAYIGNDGLANTATNADFVPLSPRALKHREVPTIAERDNLTDVIVGDQVEVAPEGYKTEPVTYLHTGVAGSLWLALERSPYQVNTVNELGLITDARVGDPAVVLGPTRQVHTFDGVGWFPWEPHKVEWRVIDAAAALPTIHNDFNNQHITVGTHDHVIFDYQNQKYLYVGPPGDPVQTSILEHFIPFGAAPGLTLLPQYELITAANDGQTVFTLAQPVTNPANIELNFRAVPRKNGPDYNVVGDQITFTMPSVEVYAGDRLEVWYE